MRYLLAALFTLFTLVIVWLPPPPAYSSTTRVMAAGDSITRGYPSDGGYRRPLTAGLPVHMVGTMNEGSFAENAHEGHDGYRLDQLDAILPAALAVQRPDVVLLMAGTNDAAQHATLNEMLYRLSVLLDHATAALPAATFLVSGLPPFPTVEYANDAVGGFNSQLAPWITAHAAAGQHVVLVHVGDTLGAPDLIDGVHPTAAGYAKMADRWHDALTPYVSAPAPTPTPSATPVPTPEPVPLAVQSACNPRPPITFGGTVTAAGGTVVLTAQAPMVAVSLGALQNATAALNGQVVASGQVVTLPPNTLTASLSVTRAAPGPWLVPYTATDACGPWQRFVGRGS